MHDTPTLFFLFKIVLTILDPLHFCINFRISLSISAKTAVGTLMETAVNLYINLESITILTILSVHEHRMSFYLFMSSLFQQCFIVFSVLLLNLFLNSLLFLVWLQMELKNFFSGCSLSLYRKTGGFLIYWSCTLQSYWTHLLALIVFCGFLRFSIQ